MKAIVFAHENEQYSLAVEQKDIPTPGPREVVVKLKAAAINHRDLNVPRDPVVRQNARRFTYGSDGAGVIHTVGSDVSGWDVGDEVILNVSVACGQCRYCLMGDHTLCDSLALLGGSAWDGTFAEYIRVPARNLVRKPEYLSFQEAAALPMALGTAWRALMTKARLMPGETVLIHGIGGGVALFSLQIVKAMGANAIVTSSSHEKLSRASAMGASAGIHYREENVAERVEQLTQNVGVDVVMDGAGVHTLPISLAAARMGGRIVNYGNYDYSESTFGLNLNDLQFKQLALYGSCVVTYPEFQDAIRFFETSKLRPVIADAFPLDRAENAWAKLAKSEQFGKIVLEM